MQRYQRQLSPKVAYACCGSFVKEQVRKHHKKQEKKAMTLFDFIESSLPSDGAVKKPKFPYMESFIGPISTPRYRPVQAVWFIPGQKGSEIAVLFKDGKVKELSFGVVRCRYCGDNTRRRMWYFGGKFSEEIPKCQWCERSSLRGGCDCDQCTPTALYYHDGT